MILTSQTYNVHHPSILQPAHHVYSLNLHLHSLEQIVYMLPLLWIFFNPSVLRTPPLYFAMQNTEEEVNTLRCIVFVFLPYISLRKRPVILRDTAGEKGNSDIKDYRLYRSISSMMSRRLYSRGILCCPPSLLWSRNQASNIPVLAGMISRHSSAILLNRLAS